MITLTEDDVPPFIAVIGPPLQPKDHCIIIEKTVVLKDIDAFEDAVGMFLGLVYVLGLCYNLKHTFEFLQRALLRIDAKTTSKRVGTLLSRLQVN